MMAVGSSSRGLVQAMAAVAIAVATVVVIGAASWERTQTPGRLAIAGTILFVVALVLGSRGLIGASSVLVLAAALFTTAGLAEPAWVRSAAVGILWFVAAELAWDAIERRDGVRRTRAYSGRRIDEVTKVVLMSMLVAAAIFALSAAAPVRTVAVTGAALLGVAAGVVMITRRLGQSDDS